MDPRRHELPAHLRAFLYSCIDSIEQLDILMLLRAGEGPYTARSVALEIGIADGRARAYLDALTARGLAYATVRDEVSYSYRPASDALGGYCDELAEALERARGDVLRFVASLPPPAIRRFANAFNLRNPD